MTTLRALSKWAGICVLFGVNCLIWESIIQEVIYQQSQDHTLGLLGARLLIALVLVQPVGLLIISVRTPIARLRLVGNLGVGLIVALVLSFVVIILLAGFPVI